MLKSEEEEGNPSNLRVSDPEGDSQNQLQLSQLVADLQSEEKKKEQEDLIRGTLPAELQGYDHCFLSQKEMHFRINSERPQANVYFKIPLEEKLKKSEPYKDGQELIVVGTPPANPKDTLGFAAMMKLQMQKGDDLNVFNEKKKEGKSRVGKLIASVMVQGEQKNEEGFVDEESEVLPQQQPVDESSHFQPVHLSDSDDIEPGKEKLRDKEGVQYVIKTISQKEKNGAQFQQRRKRQDSPIQLKQDFKSEAQNKKQYPPLPRVTNSHRQQNNLPMIKEQFSNPSLPFRSNSSQKEGILQSKIIKRNSIEVLESKKIAPLNSRMMQTDNPKPQELTHSVSPKVKNNSEPNSRSKVIKKAENNDDFEDPLPSEKNKASEDNSNKEILQRILNLEQLVQQRSNRAQQQENFKKKNITNAPKFTQEKQIDKKPSRRKIESMHRIVPEQLLNLSSIEEKADNFDYFFQKKEKKAKTSKNLEEEINNLKNKVKELELMQNQRQVKKEKLYRVSSNERNSYENGIAVNFKQYNQTSLGRRLNGYRRQQSSSEIEDEDFQELQRKIPSLDRYPRPDDTQNKIASFGINAYEAFNLRVKRYGEMDVCLTKQEVQYELTQGPALIWDYSGKLYIGAAKERHSLLEREGKGIEVIIGRSIYEGEFKKNNKHGYGIMVNFSTGEKYKGYWKNGVYDGRGKLITKQSKYTGYFVKGVQEGQGHELLSNGDQYQGDYVAGKFQGRGKYLWKSKNNVYIGEFKKGYIEGEGIWKGTQGESYEGQFSKGLKHGFGVYRWKDGKTFEGRFEHGQRVSHRSPNRRIISPQRQITYDLNETSEMRQPIVQPAVRKFTIRNLQEPTSQRRNSQQFYQI